MNRYYIDSAVELLSKTYHTPKPRWRFSSGGEEMEEWYDAEHRTLVISSNTSPDMSGVAHEFIHYLHDLQGKLRTMEQKLQSEKIADSSMDAVGAFVLRTRN